MCVIKKDGLCWLYFDENHFTNIQSRLTMFWLTLKFFPSLIYFPVLCRLMSSYVASSPFILTSIWISSSSSFLKYPCILMVLISSFCSAYANDFAFISSSFLISLKLTAVLGIVSLPEKRSVRLFISLSCERTA